MKLTANPAWLSLPPNRGKGSGAKFLRIMKLTTIIILAACLHTSAKGVAQQTITFSGKEVSLESVFTAIKKQTNYRFFFNTDMLHNASKVTLDVKNANIEQVMNMALKDQPLTFTIKGRTIFVMKKPEEEKKSTQVERTGDPITVSGRVTDENGEPLAGANVKVKGGNNGVTTDAQGRFTLNNVDPNASLEVSFVGRETQLLSVKGKTVFSVALGQRVGMLDETIVIAYGTTTRRFGTGNVSSVKASDIEKQPVNNPMLALQGRVPGLIVTQESGVLGGPVTLRVGALQNSIGYGNDPLIVIDGVPFPADMPKTGVEQAIGLIGKNPSPLNFINSADIESIEVLKDADATAIYGSRAGNGAILITTKKGKPGRMSANINVQKGWGKIVNKAEMMNTRQYLDMRYEAYQNDGINWKASSVSANDLKLWDTTRYTDWQNELIGGTAEYNNINASISGGTPNIQFLLGTTYSKTTSVFPGNFSDQRGAVNFNVSGVSANKKFKTQFSGNYLVSENRLPGFDLTEYAIRLAPNAPALYAEDGSLNWELNSAGSSTWTNPLINVLYRKYENHTNNLISNLTMSYSIFTGFTLRCSFGYNSMQTEDMQRIPLLYVAPQNRATAQRTTNFGSRKLTSWIIEPQLNYSGNIGKGKVDGLLGLSIQQSVSNAGNITGSGFGSDDVMENIAAATSLSTDAMSYSKYKYNGVFGRLGYILYQKYILSLSARRDGSSRFGKNNRFHNFGSISGAWIFSEEGYIKKYFKFLSFGKLRVSYGTTGNDQIGDYNFLSLYATNTYSAPYMGIAALSVNRLTNPYLQWEETRKFQAGIDLGFLNDRIILGATFSKNKSSNQLLPYPLPSYTGFSNIIDNFNATVQNSSLELFINSVNIKRKDFEWSSYFNITIPNNKLVAFPDLESSSYSNTLIVGQPLNVTRVFKSLGVDLTTGLYLFEDVNGNAISVPNAVTDRTVLVSTFPKYYGGLQNSITFHEFQLDFLFQVVKQVGNPIVYNNGSGTRPGAFSPTSSNMPLTLLERWQKVGDEKPIQKFSTTLTPRIISSDANYVDASYIRLKNVSLSWNLPKAWRKKIFMQGCKFYMVGQNLLTITNYKGLDPETQNPSVLPPLKVWTCGVQLSL